MVQAEEPSCGTMSYWDVRNEPTIPEVVIADGAKIERDAMDANFNMMRSENFVLKWGDSYTTNGAEENILILFECAWQKQHIEWDMLAPFGTDNYLFNVYIADTGPNTPTIEGHQAGYYTRDDQGWPMIVLKKSSLSPTLIAHEFFHALQDAVNTARPDESRWFWEATAEWASGAMYPSDSGSINNVSAYLNLSHESLNSFLSYSALAPEEEDTLANYAYGAALFPIYLHEITMDELFIPNVWKQGDPDRFQPLETIRDLLAEKGLAFHEVWMNHNSSTVFMNEYSQGGMYQELAGYGWWSDEWSGDGTAMTVETSDISIEHLGFRAHRLVFATKKRYRFQVLADPIGDHDSIAEFRAHIVQRDGITYKKIPITINDWFGEYVLEDVNEYNDVFLIVGAWADRYHSSYHDDERFYYSYAIEGLEDPNSLEGSVEPPIERKEESIDEEVLCGCATLEPISVFGLFSVLGIFSRRKRIHM
jgi:hypothetical protein